MLYINGLISTSFSKYWKAIFQILESFSELQLFKSNSGVGFMQARWVISTRSSF